MSDDETYLVKYEANKHLTELEEDDRPTLTIEIKKTEPETEPTNGRGHYCDQPLYKSILVLLISYNLFLGYYCAESPGGLEDTIIKVMGIDTTQYNLLFLVITWPTIIVNIVGGVIADRILGRRSSYIILLLIIMVGQIIWSLGSFVNLLWIVLIGRFFIGIGVALLYSVYNMFLVSWLGKKYLTLGLSIGTTFSRTGAAAALGLPQLIYSQLDNLVVNPSHRLGITILVGAGLALIGLIIVIVVAIMDKHRERLLKKNRIKRVKLSCNDVKNFDVLFWLITSLNAYFSVVFASTAIMQVFFVQKYGLSLEAASIANSFVFSATVLATPVIGYIVNAVGYHLLWAMGGIFSGLVVHLILVTSNPGVTYVPYLTGAIYSFSYILFGVSFWPIAGLIVKENQIATAYGIITSANNLFWGLMSIFSGLIIDNTGYFVLEIVYILFLYLVLMVAVLALMIDRVSKKPVVNAPGTWNMSACFIACIFIIFVAFNFGIV